MKFLLVILCIFLLLACRSNKTSTQSTETSTSTNSDYNSPSSDNSSSESSSSSSESISSSSESSSSSSLKYEDGTYCADVQYYNPNTGTQSDYQLEVEVESGSVTEIDFPQGWLDDSHFSTGGELEDGETEIESDEGYTYTVTITGTTPCEYNRVAVRCLGIDKDGSRCRKLTADPSGYCPLHRYQYYQNEDNSNNSDEQNQDDDDDNDN